MTTALDIARPLVAAGLHCFLLRGKQPAIPKADGGKGFKDATLDLAVLEDVARRYPNADGVGYQPGRSGLLVVDEDSGKSPEAAPAVATMHRLAAQHGGMPDTLTVRTGGGGRHYLFWAPVDRDLGQGQAVYNPVTDETEAGVDWRCGKGYLVAPGSPHASGRRYEWETPDGRYHPERIKPAPGWLVDYLTAARPSAPAPAGWTPTQPTNTDQARVAGAVRRAADRLAQLGEGHGRRRQLQAAGYNLGGWLWTGYPEADLRAALQDAAKRCGHFDADTARAIDSAIQDGQRAPRPLPPDTPREAPRRSEGVLPEEPPWEAYEDRPTSPTDRLAELMAAVGDADKAEARRLVAEFLRDPHAVDAAARAPAATLAAAVSDLEEAVGARQAQRFERAIRDRAKAVRNEERADTRLPDKGDAPYIATPDGRPYVVVSPGNAVWYVATADGYHHCDKALLSVEIPRHWPDVRVTSEEGKPLSPSTLYALYGATADGTEYTYSGVTRYQPGDTPGRGKLIARTLFEAPPEPVRHEDVLDWLELLGGEKLLDWLSVLPVLDLPTAALVLLGGPGLGKSMVGAAAGRYFGRSLTSYDDVFKESGFNDALLRCPVVFLDEGATVDGNSAGFRRLVGNRAHAIQPKNKPSTTLLGCPRLIVCANNDDPLKLGREPLTSEDEAAIGERVLVIRCNGAAKAHLIDLGGAAYTADWVERQADGGPGKVAETIAWLAANRHAERGSRFLVEGDASYWAATIGTRAGLAGTIIEAIRVYLDMEPVERQRFAAKPPFLWHEDYPGHVLVSNGGLREHWRTLIGGDERSPTHKAVTNELRKLSGRGDAIRVGGDPRGPRMYPVPETLIPDVS